MRYFVTQDTDGAYVLWKLEDGVVPLSNIIAVEPKVDEEAKTCEFGGHRYSIRSDRTLHDISV